MSQIRHPWKQPFRQPLMRTAQRASSSTAPASVRPPVWLGVTAPLDLQKFAQVININLIGTFNTLRLWRDMEDLDALETEEQGIIINTASIAAFEGQIGRAAYSASKGGVHAMTIPVARELARYGIKVLTVAPGIMGTPMLLRFERFRKAWARPSHSSAAGLCGGVRQARPSHVQ